MTTLYAHIGRANRQRLALLQDGQAVAGGAVTRAVLRFGPYCLDTDEAGDPVALVDGATVVEAQLGLTPGITQGAHRGKLTIYDNLNTEGIAWQDVIVVVDRWNVCE